MSHDHDSHETPPSFWGSRYAIGLLVLGAVAGYFLLKEHLAHVVGVLPFLLVLACPLMHIFMHRGHGQHHGNSHARGKLPPSDQTKPGARP